MKNIKRCYGKFNISHKMIEQNPNIVLSLMKDILVTRAESMYNEGIIKYIGISEKYFDEIKPGEKIPKYKFMIYRNYIVVDKPEYMIYCNRCTND